MNAVLATLALALPAIAQPPDYDALFRAAEAGPAPAGVTRGTVLAVEGRLPRVKAALQGALWKGKVFHGDGTFTNRWLGGIRAGTAATAEEPSWADGRPALAVHYPPSAPVFGTTRDELRQIEPGVWLGRSFDVRTGEPKNFFLLRAR